MKIGVVAWGKSNCFGVKWQVDGMGEEKREKRQELIFVVCPSPDGSGNPFYAELVSVYTNINSILVEMLKRVQHKKIAADSGK
jgi:hypothetical protein